MIASIDRPCESEILRDQTRRSLTLDTPLDLVAFHRGQALIHGRTPGRAERERLPSASAFFVPDGAFVVGKGDLKQRPARPGVIETVVC